MTKRNTMPNTYRLLAAFLLGGFFPVVLSGQSLIEDAARLVTAKRMLTQMPDSLETDSMRMAFAEAMAILRQYDADGLEQGEKAADLLETAEHYQDNQVLSEWLPLRQLKSYAEASDSVAMSRYRAQRTKLQQAPRERMARALKSSEGQSMADFLSISKALQRYTIPPVESLSLIHI